MLDTPGWIIELLDEDGFKCPHCKADFDPGDIRACGVRLSFRDEKKQVLYVEYHCSQCAKRTRAKRPPTLLEIWDMSFEDFAFSIIDTDEAPEEEEKPVKKQGKRKKIPKRRRKQKSKISDEEVAGLKKLLNTSESHEDFMIGLGMTRAELGKFKKENDTKDK